MNLLQQLIELQEELGFLPEATLNEFCQTHRVPRAKVEELCSFYHICAEASPLRTG